MIEHGLAKVDFTVSTTCVDPSYSETWRALRDFSKWNEYFMEFKERTVQSLLLPGNHHCMIGACRITHVGHGKLVEQLTSLDDGNASLSYKLVTHPDNINPFGPSFVNYICSMQLRPITMTGESFVEVHVSFLTEAAAAEYMQHELRSFHEAHLTGLRSYVKQQHGRRSFQSLGRRSLDRCMSRLREGCTAVGCDPEKWSSAPPLHLPEHTLRQNSDDSSGSQTYWGGL